jgi:glycolate oxidase
VSLPKHVYKELENIVGSENISGRQYILASHRQPTTMSIQKPASPEAVILPGSTEEVQAIIKICNRYSISYIATVSSLIAMAYANQPGTVILHMKRMNKILEINEEDHYAIIEPGVRHGQLKTELMKRGLSYPVAAVGPGGSVLVNFACSSGDNHTQYGASRTNRYILGTEWILPTGKLLKVGSLATDAGWFCPDGPGPSLRGLIKGFAGQMGNLGVITKIAIGLDAWKGPKVMPTEGHTPSYKIRLPQDCHKVFIFKFSTLDKVRDAMIEIGKAEIGYAVQKFFNATAALLATESANDFWGLWNSGLFQKELARPLYVYLATWSPEEMVYEENILRDIIRETGGEEVDESIRHIYEDNMDFFILVGFLQRVLRLGRGWAPTKLSADSIFHMFEVGKAIPEFITEFIEKGLILNAPDNFQIVPLEYGHAAHIELLFLWDRNLSEEGKIPLAFMQKSTGTDIKHGYHASMPPNSKSLMEQLGPLYSNYHIWANKIKEAFDPNMVSNPIR